MDLHNWKELLEHYNYTDATAIFQRIEEKGYIATQEDYDIINMIVLWKINREVKICGETIEYINSIAKTTKSPEEALNNMEVQDCLKEILNSHGIRLPMASAILHFYQPKAFPITHLLQ